LDDEEASERQQDKHLRLTSRLSKGRLAKGAFDGRLASISNRSSFLFPSVIRWSKRGARCEGSKGVERWRLIRTCKEEIC
jgi:hypothetical protein